MAIIFANGHIHIIAEEPLGEFTDLLTGLHALQGGKVDLGAFLRVSVEPEQFGALAVTDVSGF